MSDMQRLLAELRAKIEVSKKTLDEQEKALKIVEAMMGVSVTSAATTPTPAITVPTTSESQSEPIELNSLVIPPPPVTLKDEVIDIIKRLGDQEFNVTHIDTLLKRMGKVVTGKSPKSRISMAISSLVESGMLVKTFEGAGHVPHRYKIRKEEIEAKGVKSDSDLTEQQKKHDELFAE